MARIPFLLIFILYLLDKAESIRCYSCADSHDCETDYSRLIKARDHGGYFNRNCTRRSQSYCMIESIKKEDKAVSFIRDCSDGKTFSYKDIPRLDHIFPNNQTECAYYQAYIVCISVCQTDFCNGPQEGLVSHASDRRTLTLPILCLLWMILL